MRKGCSPLAHLKKEEERDACAPQFFGIFDDDDFIFFFKFIFSINVLYSPFCVIAFSSKMRHPSSHPRRHGNQFENPQIMEIQSIHRFIVEGADALSHLTFAPFFSFFSFAFIRTIIRCVVCADGVRVLHINSEQQQTNEMCARSRADATNME